MPNQKSDDRSNQQGNMGNKPGNQDESGNRSTRTDKPEQQGGSTRPYQPGQEEKVSSDRDRQQGQQQKGSSDRDSSMDRDMDSDNPERKKNPGKDRDTQDTGR